MDKTFEKFLRSGIDLSLIGIERREDNASYFCTPKGASIFGWAGVDGIHYCFVRGFGGMVFAVSPMNSAQDFVHPIARDFADFLRLLLACGDAAALEQACRLPARESSDTGTEGCTRGDCKTVRLVAAGTPVEIHQGLASFVRLCQNQVYR